MQILIKLNQKKLRNYSSSDKYICIFNNELYAKIYKRLIDLYM